MDFRDQFFAFARTAGPQCRLRYAPTPSGYLHIGNALNFTLNWLVARLNGGTILLRIDDLDADRKRPEYIEDVFESLTWLGLDWDKGPACTPELRSGTLPERSSGVQALDFEKNWSQHQRLPFYFKALEKLRETGHLFACQKSRRDLAPFGGGYPPEFRDQNLHLDDPDVAWRMATPTDSVLPDFIVRRRDGIPAYQIASVVDDLHFGITHAVRGADLESSTLVQTYLAQCLGQEDFLKIKFLHHPLLTDATGEKLSKSVGATSLRAMRQDRVGPEEVFRQVAEMLGIVNYDAWNKTATLPSVCLLNACQKIVPYLTGSPSSSQAVSPPSRITTS